MGNRVSQKPRVEHDHLSENDRLPEGVRLVATHPKPVVLGEAHAVFHVDAAPEAEVILCLSEGRMVGLLVRGEVSTTALHRIPVRTLERAALGAIRRKIDLLAEYPEVKAAIEEYADGFAGYEQAVVVAPSGASRERYLAGLAGRYVMLSGESGSPTKALAAELFLSAGTVRDQLGDARRQGLLSRPGKGRAGGELTPKALELLSTHDEKES